MQALPISALLTSAKPLLSLRHVAPIVLGVAAGFLGTHLILSLNWMLVLGLVVAIPAAVLLFRYPFFGFSLWLLLAPFLMATDTIAERRVYWIIHRALPLLILPVVAMKQGVIGRRLYWLGWPEAAMTGYVLASLASIVLRSEEALATSYLFYDRIISPMCLYFLIRLWQPDERDFRRLIPVVLFLAGTQSLIGILSWVGPQYLPADWLGHVGARTVGSLGSPSVYSVAMLFAGGVLVHVAMNSTPGVMRVLYAGMATLAFLGVFLSLSRACWLAGLLVLAGLVALYPRQLIRFGLCAVPVVLIAGGVFFTTHRDMVKERLYSAESERSAIARLPVYLAGIRMFLAHPFTGWGYGNFDRYDREFQGRMGDLADDNKDHASHNFYVTLVAEQGLLGLVLFLGPVISWLRLTRRRWPKLNSAGLWSRKLLGMLWLSLLAHVVVNNFSNMRVVFGLGLWWVTLGLIATLVASLGTSPQNRESAEPANPPTPGLRAAERLRSL